MKLKRNPVIIIFLTVFLDLVGFGMIIPLNPYLARTFGADPFQVGCLMTVYSLMQFICSPFWGKLSDRVGRRPIILFSLLGVGLSHIGFAFAGTYTMLFVARMCAGICSANISTAMAYIADVTEAKDRSKGMGLIGAAFGLGFLVGPFLGGVFSIVGSELGSAPPFGPSFPAVAAGVLCLLNVAFAWFFLVESLPPEKRAASVARPREGRFRFLAKYLRRPVLGPLMGVYFLSSLAMAHMEASLFLFMQDRFQWDQMKSSFGFGYVGIVMVITQGYLIRKLIPRFGEGRILLTGLLFATIGFLGIAYAPSILWMAVAVTFLGLGNGFANPSLTGSMSLLTDADEQGQMMGVNQGLSALGRVIGPVTGGLLYRDVGGFVPFLVAGGLMALGFVVANFSARGIPNSGQAGRGRDDSAAPTESDVMSLGSYQMQNLWAQRVPFVLIDIASGDPESSGFDFMASSVRIQAPDVLAYVRANVKSADVPVILVCEQGQRSVDVALVLLRENYPNAYVIEGGHAGLKAERS